MAGYSVATAECVFSARNRIDTPCRRRLTPYKQGNLTLLHFEKKIVRSVRFPEILSKFKAPLNLIFTHLYIKFCFMLLISNCDRVT